MDAEERSSAHPVAPAVERALLARPQRYGFVHALSLLERLTPNAPRLGELGPASREAVRLRHDPSLAFPASDISSLIKTLLKNPNDIFSEKREIYEVVTTFLGVTGAASPLPSYFAEEVLHALPESTTERDFLDIFHHRLLTLLYRWRVKYDHPLEYTTGSRDPLSLRALALTGFDAFAEGFRAPRSLPTWRLLRLAPLLATRARGAHGLKLALADVLGDALGEGTVEIEQFVARWVDLQVPMRVKLGVQNTTLGENMVIGMRVLDRGGKFRLSIGPVPYASYKRFLPGGDLMPVVNDVVGAFTRDPLDFDVELTLDESASLALCISRDKTRASKLGVDTWLGGKKGGASRVVLDPREQLAGGPAQESAQPEGGASQRDPARPDAGDGQGDHGFSSPVGSWGDDSGAEAPGF